MLDSVCVGLQEINLLQNLAKTTFAVKCMFFWLCQTIFIFFVISSKVYDNTIATW